jgi:hypothetical protein
LDLGREGASDFGWLEIAFTVAYAEGDDHQWPRRSRCSGLPVQRGEFVIHIGSTAGRKADSDDDPVDR